MNLRSTFVVLLIGCGLWSTQSSLHAAPATTRASTTAPSATISPDARPLLDKLSAVYTRPGPWRFSAEMTGRFDVAGRAKDYSLKVAGQTDGVGRFRHDADPVGLLVSDAKDSYLYDRRRDAYAELKAAPGRVAADLINANYLGVLVDENPALLMTLTTDPAGLLARCATAIRTADTATTRPAGAVSGLLLEQGTRTQTLWLNDAGEIVAATIDYTPLMKQRGATAIKAATVTLVYRPVPHDPPAAEAFAWRPPATAMAFDAEDEQLQAATQPTTIPSSDR